MLKANIPGLIDSSIKMGAPGEYQPLDADPMSNKQLDSDTAGGAPTAQPMDSALDAPAAPQAQTPPATAADVTGTTPTTATLGTVNQPTDTVAGQMDTLLSKDNPYIERARAKAAEVANSRGLLNSSMAAGAGEAAAIDAALPIASADANIYSTQRLTNQGAQNQFGLQAAGGDIAARAAVLQAQLQTGLIGEQGAQTRMTAAQQDAAQKELATLQGQIQSGQIAQQGQIQQNLQLLKGDQANAVAQIEANYKMLMQTSASASTMFSDISKTIGAIMNDPNTTAEQKQNAVNNQIALLNAQLSVLGGINNLDLGGLLDFTSLSNVTPPAPPAPPAPPEPPPDLNPNGGGNTWSG